MEKVPSGLSSLKSNVDKIDVDKLVSVPKNLSKLSDVVKNDVVKKTDYNTKIKDIEHKIPYIINSTTTAVLNAKIDDIKSKIPNITNLSPTAALNAKINEIKGEIPDHSKYITTPEFNMLTAENISARLKQPNLATKCDIADFVKKEDFDDKLNNLNKKVTSNKTKHVVLEDELKNCKIM